jgi:hypothetical protein
VTRVVFTLLAAAVVLALHALTPAGLAWWLLQVVLVWAATSWANRWQMVIVAGVCAAFILLGFLLSPKTEALWVEVSNLLLSLGTVAALSHSYLRRLATEDSRRKAAKELGQMIRILSGLLPMCTWCMKIRNDAGIWEPLETYTCKYSPAEFTYGMCEKCAHRFNHINLTNNPGIFE